jgi:hypothetical protein
MGSEKVPFFINLKYFFHHNSYGVSTNADLYADSKFVEMGSKKSKKKSYRQKTKRIWSFLGFHTFYNVMPRLIDN